MTDKNISDLSAIGTLTDADVIEVYQPSETAGTRNRKATRAQLRKDFQKEVITTLTSGTTVTVDCSLGKNFKITLAHNVGTLTITNLNGSGLVTEIEMHITQDATGSRTFALPASFKAHGGSDTSILATANRTTVLNAKTFDNGTTWRYVMQDTAP